MFRKIQFLLVKGKIIGNENKNLDRILKVEFDSNYVSIDCHY